MSNKIAEIDKRIIMLEEIIASIPEGWISRTEEKNLTVLNNLLIKYKARLKKYKHHFGNPNIKFAVKDGEEYKKGAYSGYHPNGFDNLYDTLTMATNQDLRYNEKAIILQLEFNRLLQEREAEEQYIVDQEILQQQQATEAAKAAVAKALAEVDAAKNKSEQEKQKALKELSVAKTAKRLAEKGDPESSRILLGLAEPKNYKKPLIISGIVLVASGLGFGIYKLIK